MDENKINSQIRIVATVCGVYLLLTIFYHHIDKYLTGAAFLILFFLIPLAFIALIVYAVKGLVLIVRKRKHLTFRVCLPPIIALTTLSYTLFIPLKLNSEYLESKVLMKACREGTQNTNIIKFRNDQSFEIQHWSFSSSWTLGNWRKSGDTVFMKFEKEKDKLLGDTIIIIDGYLIPISEIRIHSLQSQYRYYYLGDCKGEN